MPRQTTVEIDEESARFIEAQLNLGSYDDAGDVMRAGLRLLAEREGKLAELRQALREGEESGPAAPFDVEAFIASKRGE